MLGVVSSVNDWTIFRAEIKWVSIRRGYRFHWRTKILQFILSCVLTKCKSVAKANSLESERRQWPILQLCLVSWPWSLKVLLHVTVFRATCLAKNFLKVACMIITSNFPSCNWIFVFFKAHNKPTCNMVLATCFATLYSQPIIWSYFRTDATFFARQVAWQL